MSYVSPTRLAVFLEKLKALFATTITYTATIGTSWTGEEAPYIQTVAVTGILASDNPVVDVVVPENFEEAKPILEAAANIYRMETANGSIKAYATNPTETNINIQIKVVR